MNSLITIVVDCVNRNIVHAFATFKSDESILCGFCNGYDRATCMRIPPTNMNCWITHCNMFCNVHRILRKTDSISWENTVQRLPWLGEDAYLYACCFMYMNSELWDLLVLIYNRYFFIVPSKLLCIFWLLSLSYLLISSSPRIYRGILPSFLK
jgi:hypothetical protein